MNFWCLWFTIKRRDSICVTNLPNGNVHQYNGSKPSFFQHNIVLYVDAEFSDNYLVRAVDLCMVLYMELAGLVFHSAYKENCLNIISITQGYFPWAQKIEEIKILFCVVSDLSMSNAEIFQFLSLFLVSLGFLFSAPCLQKKFSEPFSEILTDTPVFGEYAKIEKSTHFK